MQDYHYPLTFIVCRALLLTWWVLSQSPVFLFVSSSISYFAWDFEGVVLATGPYCQLLGTCEIFSYLSEMYLERGNRVAEMYRTSSISYFAWDFEEVASYSCLGNRTVSPVARNEWNHPHLSEIYLERGGKSSRYVAWAGYLALHRVKLRSPSSVLIIVSSCSCLDFVGSLYEMSWKMVHWWIHVITKLSLHYTA